MKVENMKEYVTHFSEQLRNETQHKQEVVVGGKIISITPPVLDEYPTYLISLDDHVGTIQVYVPHNMMTSYSNDFEIGKYVFIKGFVSVISRYIGESLKRDISVIAYDVNDITKQEI